MTKTIVYSFFEKLSHQLNKPKSHQIKIKLNQMTCISPKEQTELQKEQMQAEIKTLFQFCEETVSKPIRSKSTPKNLNIITSALFRRH